MAENVDVILKQWSKVKSGGCVDVESIEKSAVIPDFISLKKEKKKKIHLKV